MVDRPEEYLGDAVYASFDGYHIWLRTGDGNDNRVALEPPVLEAFVRYASKLHPQLRDLIERSIVSP
jgi:hypothetical protein